MTTAQDDHYDVQFTTRQLAILLGLLVLVVGGVFVGGVLIGRNLAPPTIAGSAPPPVEQPVAQPAAEPMEQPAEELVEERRPDEPLIPSGTTAQAPELVPEPPPAPEPAPEPQPAPAAPAATGDFTIQIAALRDRAAAEQLQQDLSALGLEAYLEAMPRGLIRVRVGRFVTREDARATVTSLDAAGHQAIVVPR